MPIKLTTTILIHKFRLKIIANDKEVFRLIVDQLDHSTFKQIQKPKFEIVFNLKKVNFYDIPQAESDIFEQEPIFQDEYITDNKIIINVGLRTFRINVDPKNNYVNVYIASGQDVDRNLLFDLIFFQPLRFLLSFHKLYILHSACVAKDSEAVLFAGRPGCGKSVISFSLVRGGFSYVSDDDTFFSQKGNIVECSPFCSNPKIKDNLIKYFPEIKKSYLRLLPGEQRKILDIKKLFPGSIQTRAIPKLIIFPIFSKKSKIKIEPIDRQEALRRLIEDKFRIFQGQYENISRLHFKTLSNLVKQVKTYQLFYRDNDINKIPKIVAGLF